MPDALPVTTLPIYPGFGQAPSMLGYIPSYLVSSIIKDSINNTVLGCFLTSFLVLFCTFSWFLTLSRIITVM